MVHIDRQHRHAMICRIAHNLRGRIKSHRLRIEQSAGKRRWIVAFEPAGDIDQMRKAGGMAFRKAIFAKTLDLIEAALRKVAVIAARHHTLDHHVLQLLNHAPAAESSHRFAQPIGL